MLCSEHVNHHPRGNSIRSWLKADRTGAGCRAVHALRVFDQASLNHIWCVYLECILDTET
jgi:hypothetical protein